MLQMIFSRNIVVLLAIIFASFAFPVYAESGYYIMTNSVDRYIEQPDYDLSLLPGEYQSVLANYRLGRFRLAILQLQELISIGLPDGRMDGYLFITAECYRSIGLDKHAVRFYRRLADEYPGSPFYFRSLFRLIEDSYNRNDDNGSIYYYSLLMQKDSIGEMADAAKFTEGKRLYRKNLFDDAEKIMASISDKSPLRHASLFVRSLAALELNNFEKALLQLDAVVRKSSDPDLRDEALLVMGSVYIRLKKLDKAEETLVKIPVTSKRYGEVLIFLSQIKLAGNDFANTIILGEQLLKLNGGEYMFEAAMVLETAYIRTRQEAKINSLRSYLEISVRRKKLVFDIYKELDLVADRHTSFGVTAQTISEKLTMLEDKRRVSSAYDSLSGIYEAIRKRSLDLLKELEADAHISGGSGVYELRFIEYVDKQIKELGVKADSISSVMKAFTTGREGVRDSSFESVIMLKRDSVITALRHYRELRDDVRFHALSSNPAYAGAEEAQAKFVDWSMMHLAQMKQRLGEVYREIGRLNRSAPSKPTEEEKNDK